MADEQSCVHEYTQDTR